MKNQCLNFVSKASVLAATLLLANCANQAISELESARLEGTPFDQHLAKEYEAFAKKDSNEYNHQLDARHFAIKGLQAAEGLDVLPEDPRHWDLPDSALSAVTEGRERLTFALNKSGRIIAPELAAKTQVSYDCWIQETENNDKSESWMCYKGFMDSLKRLEVTVHKHAPTFTVFFEKDSALLTEKSKAVLTEAALVAKNLPSHRVTISGHTDESGGRKHNLVLSQNRAMAVREALKGMGVASNPISAIGEGETWGKMLEPKNRRVDIQIR